MKVLILFLFELIILGTSLGTLACHVAQLVLLSDVENTGQWWPSYKPYIFYYVGSIVSILSSTSLVLFNCFYLKTWWIHRIISAINLLLTVAFVVYNSLESGIIPWSGTATKSNTKGFASYCSNYSDNQNMFLRCWLTNGSWLGMVIYGFFWLLLVLYLFILKRSDLNNDDYDIYDYKNDVPMVNEPQTTTDYYSPYFERPRKISKTLLQDKQPPHS